MANPFANARFRWSENTELLSVEDFRNAARRRLPHMVWAYVDGGAEDLLTLNANRDAFARWRFRPKTLAGHERFDLRTEVCGTELALPVFLAPTAMSGLSHWTGELAGAQAAERAGTRMVLSTAASYTPEEIAAATDEKHFFQLYPWADVASGGRALSGELMQRAWNAGYRVIFVTVDVPVHGNRESERRHGMGVNPILTPRRMLDLVRKQRWTRDYLRRQRATPRLMMELMSARNLQDTAWRQIRVMRPELNWEDLRWMRDQWRGQFYVKGLLHPEDAETAVALGVDGIVVSNHGGRQLDGAQASLDALPDIVAQVNRRVPVLLDGGVRRGADVVKALCLGASAVGIGRPWLYGLAVNGGAGVEQILGIFREEMLRTLTLLGCPSASALDRSMLVSEIAPN